MSCLIVYWQPSRPINHLTNYFRCMLKSLFTFRASLFTFFENEGTKQMKTCPGPHWRTHSADFLSTATVSYWTESILTLLRVSHTLTYFWSPPHCQHWPPHIDFLLFLKRVKSYFTVELNAAHWFAQPLLTRLCLCLTPTHKHTGNKLIWNKHIDLKQHH